MAFLKNSIFKEKWRPLVQFPWADTFARARNKISTFPKIAFEGYPYVQAVSQLSILLIDSLISYYSEWKLQLHEESKFILSFLMEIITSRGEQIHFI